LNGPKKGMFYNCLNFIFTCSCRTKKWSTYIEENI
jgi:hypothetical protein